ncbi:arylsulfatase [Psychrosphaera sp. 1_MG-2023]|nr:arylsulfatase [Psychrosphaera sp. 1_MG-2023]MDO6721333.1 arylsulfatase [Psychrosphaera sp. 1_MG-2023]
MKSLRSLSMLFGIAFLASCSNTQETNTQEDPDKAEFPNIIYILADDAGVGDVSSYNPQSKIPTPNLDELAAQGIRFTDAHSPSSVCTPTRYSVLTGRYSWRSRLKKGVLFGYGTALIEDGRETVASVLKSSGYNTAGIGKWHIGLGSGKKTDYSKPLTPGPIDNGFDYYYGIPASLDMDPYVYFENDKLVQPATLKTGKHGLPRGVGGGEEFWRGGKIAKDFKHIEVLPNIVKRAEDYIVEQKNSKKPFFLYLPLPAPHQPWLPTAEFKGKSQAGAYGDFMVQVDSVVGQIVRATEKAGLTKNTLIIFTSDNASHWYQRDIDEHGHRANLNYRGHKGDIYEGGHRVPFIAKWPNKIPSNQVSDELISLTDLMATAAAITNTTLPANAGEDSVNILPVLTQQNANIPPRQTTITHSVDGTFSIRLGAWKLIDAPHSGGFNKGKLSQYTDMPQVQLYNLDSDPSESNNVYDKYPAKVTEMLTLLAKIKQQSS